jgi:acetolactate synthase-1/2/3 large subunit
VNPLEFGAPPGAAVHPIEAIAVMNRVLPSRIRMFVDIGNCMAWFIRYFERTEPYTWHVNLAHGSMGHSIPAAMGASIATNDPVIAVLGDAAFKMCAAELHTASEQHVALKVIVFNDSGHGMVEKGVNAQWPGLEPRYRFARRVDAAVVGAGFGVSGFRAETTGEFEAALLRSLELGGPTLVDLAIDPRADPPIGSRTDMLAASFAPKGDA